MPSLLRAAAFFILSLFGKRIVSPEDPPLSLSHTHSIQAMLLLQFQVTLEAFP